VEVEAFRSRIALREAGRVLLGQGGGLYLAKREKTAFWPEELGTRWVPRIRPEVLLFPSVGDQHTTVAPLGPKETLAELVRWSAWVMLEPHLAQEHLELLAELGSQARSYRVTLGRDLFGDPNVLTRLIA
jgi:hypothetical protein